MHDEYGRMGLIERDERVKEIVDQAHAEDWGGKHHTGFCEACADAYLVAQHAVPDDRGAVSENEQLRAALIRWRSAYCEWCDDDNARALAVVFDATAHLPTTRGQ